MSRATTSGTYLDGIVRDVRARLERETPAADGAGALSPIRSLAASIRARSSAGEIAVVAELKRRSPSVGELDSGARAAARAATYAGAGAAGVSVLTEPDHFGGSLDDLRAARAASASCPVPLLRKDFVIESVQLHHARVAGADAVLLIAALHEPAALLDLVQETHELGLEVLLEVHDEQELAAALATPAQLIGINNRDLRSFEVDLAVTERLAPLVPADRLVVAESGVRTPDDARRARDAGAHAVLVGEALMRSADPAALLRRLGGGR